MTNDFIKLFKHLEENNMPDKHSKKVMMPLIRNASVQCILNIFNALCKNRQPELLEYIYTNFKPGINYLSYCFKIVNKYYLNSIIHKFQT